VTFGSLEDKITDENPVRFIDAFVNELYLPKLANVLAFRVGLFH
jgi:hypothetical protein